MVFVEALERRELSRPRRPLVLTVAQGVVKKTVYLVRRDRTVEAGFEPGYVEPGHRVLIDLLHVRAGAAQHQPAGKSPYVERVLVGRLLRATLYRLFVFNKILKILRELTVIYQRLHTVIVLSPCAAERILYNYKPFAAICQDRQRPPEPMRLKFSDYSVNFSCQGLKNGP